MTEKELAENIIRVHGRTLVDNEQGITISGAVLADKYIAMFSRDGYCSQNVWECGQALRHWIEAAGYDENGQFKYIMSNHIQNC